MFITLHVKNVPSSYAGVLTVCVVYLMTLDKLNNSAPLVVFALYKHEHKLSVLHFSIKRHPSYQEPMPSKVQLLFASYSLISSQTQLLAVCGFRAFKCRPLFSQDNPNVDKHKAQQLNAIVLIELV